LPVLPNLRFEIIHLTFKSGWLVVVHKEDSARINKLVTFRLDRIRLLVVTRASYNAVRFVVFAESNVPAINILLFVIISLV